MLAYCQGLLMANLISFADDDESEGLLGRNSEAASAANSSMEYGLETADEFSEAGISLVPTGHAR
jgi:hypothetical protein